jgi:tRNA threonylcarbamoyladenosine biosynthesis protein TsaE
MTHCSRHGPELTARLNVVCLSAAQTRRLGQTIGQSIQTGIVIALMGGMGSGKTTFVQGLARGLDVTDSYVTSPTFSLINVYQGRMPLWHADLYRLDQDGQVHDIGLDEIVTASGGVVAVEWAERLDLGSLLPRLEVNFSIIDNDRRRIEFCPYGQAASDLLRRASQEMVLS